MRLRASGAADKYPLATAQERELPEQRIIGRYASGSKRGKRRGVLELENLRGQTRQEAARIESEPSICGAGEDGWFAYRIAAKRLRAALVKLYAAAAQFERGQLKRA